MRKATLGGVVLLAVALTAVPVAADDTVATFDVTAGLLDITVPASADLGDVAPDDSIDSELGAVTVNDARAAADASWTATVSTTNFSTGAGGASQVVLAAEIEYWSGPATATTGNGTFIPGQPTAADADPLSTSVTAFAHSGGTGNNTATWEPNIVVNVPLDNEAGTYTGTVTHSVA